MKAASSGRSAAAAGAAGWSAATAMGVTPRSESVGVVNTFRAPSVLRAGGSPLLMAAFSAGSPNATQLIGSRTLRPCIRMQGAITSSIV